MVVHDSSSLRPKKNKKFFIYKSSVPFLTTFKCGTKRLKNDSKLVYGSVHGSRSKFSVGGFASPWNPPVLCTPPKNLRRVRRFPTRGSRYRPPRKFPGTPRSGWGLDPEKWVPLCWSWTRDTQKSSTQIYSNITPTSILISHRVQRRNASPPLFACFVSFLTPSVISPFIDDTWFVC